MEKPRFDELLKVYTAVLVSPQGVYQSQEHGVRPLLGWLDRQPETMKGAFLADRAIGAAAAWLAVKGKVSYVYGGIMSANGMRVLEQAGIRYQYGEAVPEILRADKQGLCPLEAATRDAGDAEAALAAIRQVIRP